MAALQSVKMAAQMAAQMAAMQVAQTQEGERRWGWSVQRHPLGANSDVHNRKIQEEERKNGAVQMPWGVIQHHR